MAPSKPWWATALQIIDSRLWLVTQTVLIPQFITKFVFKPQFFGSYVLTVSLWIAFFIVLRVFYALVLYPRFFTPFRSLPTPKKRSPLWGNMKPRFSHPTGLAVREMAETVPNEGLIRYYGFLSQERILVTSPKGLGELLVQMGYDFTKPFQMKYAISRITGEGLGYAEGDEHRMQRKHLLPAFSYRHIKNLYPIFWKKGAQMVRLIEKELKDTSGAVDVKTWASRVTLDIIGVTGMDHDFQALTHPDNDLNKVYRELFKPPGESMRYFAQLGYFINPVVLQWLPLPRNKIIKESSGYLRNVARQMIRQKREKEQSSDKTKSDNRKPEKDLIGVAMQSGVFTEENLVDQMMMFLAAGHETTASALQWLVWALCKHQDIQSRLREEIRSKLPAVSATAAGAGQTIPDATLVDSLPYLNAVCSEVIRYYPPVPFTIRVALHDAFVLGTYIPKDTILAVSAEATNHDPSLWGPDAADFNPERWMGPGNANSGGATSNYALMTFIHGPRSCIGNNFTKSELLCLAVVLVGRFRMTYVEPDLELKLEVGVTYAPQKGSWARFEPVEGW